MSGLGEVSEERAPHLMSSRGSLTAPIRWKCGRLRSGVAVTMRDKLTVIGKSARDGQRQIPDDHR
jgi:hypothetical protein